MNFTPAQVLAIKGWTEQRDSLLRDIGVLSVELEEKTKANKQGGLDFAALEKQIAEARGRIAEIDVLEARRKDSVSVEIAELEVRKSRLEGECAVLQERAAGASEKYAVVTMSTIDLQSAHNTMKDQAAIVNKVAGELIETSTHHLSDVKGLMVEIKTISDQVIEKNNENVKQTGIILEKLPRYIFELQKPIPVRRLYAPQRGTHIPPGDAINEVSPT